MSPWQAMVQEDTDKDGVITWDEYQKNTYGDKHDDFDEYVHIFLGNLINNDASFIQLNHMKMFLM